MRQFLLGGFLSAVICALFAGGALACIWDREVVNLEREFKSHYKTDHSSEPVYQSPAPLKNQLLAYGATGLGSALLLGSVVVTLKRPS